MTKPLIKYFLTTFFEMNLSYISHLFKCQVHSNRFIWKYVFLLLNVYLTLNRYPVHANRYTSLYEVQFPWVWYIFICIIVLQRITKCKLWETLQIPIVIYQVGKVWYICNLTSIWTDSVYWWVHSWIVEDVVFLTQWHNQH